MADNELINEQKRRQLLAMLDRGRGLTMLHLDPRVEGVQVPGHLAHSPVLRLNIAYGFNLPALDVDEGGVYAMLSFGGRDFGCNLPWRAIFALTMPEEDHEGMIWPADVPPELRPFFDQAGVGAGAVPVSLRAVAGDEEAPAEAPAAKPRLAVVRGDEAPTVEAPTVEAAAPPPGAPAPPRRGGPSLQLVKG